MIRLTIAMQHCSMVKRAVQSKERDFLQRKKTKLPFFLLGALRYDLWHSRFIAFKNPVYPDTFFFESFFPPFERKTMFDYHLQQIYMPTFIKSGH